jgi:hypothetical protein
MDGTRTFISSLCCALLAACVAREPLPAHYAGPRALPSDLVDRYGYSDPPIDQIREPTRRRLGFTVRQIMLLPGTDAADSAGAGGRDVTTARADARPESGSIEFDYYDVEGTQRTPVVVLLPVLNGPFISRYFARYFAHRGWASVVVDRDRDVLHGLDEAEQAIRENLVEYRRILDWIVRHDELDAGNIGLFGISLGAMDAVMLAAVDDRVDALFAAMAGGDLASLAMSTRYRKVTRIVDDMLHESGLSRGGLQRQLDEQIATDPLALAPYVDAERVLLVLTRSDAIVPFEAQQELRIGMGSPEALYLPTGHRMSVVYFPLLRNSAYEFFARKFDAPPTLLTN